MNEYEKRVNKQRKQADRITLDTLKKINGAYKNAMEDLSKGIEGSLRERWEEDYKKEIKGFIKSLDKAISEYTAKGIEDGAEVGASFYKNLFNDISKKEEIEIPASFNSMFSEVQANVVSNIYSGDLYKDHKTLSERIWNISNDSGKAIDDVITEGIAAKKSAREMANDLREFAKSPDKRNPELMDTYGGRVAKDISYKAMRLARTAINHAYQTATIQSSQNNPYVCGIMWDSSLDKRTCPLCMSRHGKTFPKDDVPLDHPGGRCTMIPVIPKSSEEIGEELRRWVDGESNEKLDEWYKVLMNYSDSGYNEGNGFKFTLKFFGNLTDKESVLKDIDSGAIDRKTFYDLRSLFRSLLKSGIQTEVGLIKDDEDRFWHIVRGHQELLNKNDVREMLAIIKNPYKIFNTKDRFGSKGIGFISDKEDTLLVIIRDNNIMTVFRPKKKYIENQIEEGGILWSKE